MTRAWILVIALLATACAGSVTEDDPQVIAALDATAPEVRDRADRLMSALVLPALPAGSAVVAERAHRQCNQGQQNWKIQDPHDLTCSVGHEVVIAIPTVTDWDTSLLRIHHALVDAGFTNRWDTDEPFGLEEVVIGYGPDVGIRRPQPGLQPDTTVPYGPQHFPGASYVDADTGATLAVSFTGPDDRFTHGRDTVYRTPAGADITAPALVASMPRSGYGLSVRVGRSLDW